MGPTLKSTLVTSRIILNQIWTKRGSQWLHLALQREHIQTALKVALTCLTSVQMILLFSSATSSVWLASPSYNKQNKFHMKRKFNQNNLLTKCQKNVAVKNLPTIKWILILDRYDDVEQMMIMITTITMIKFRTNDFYCAVMKSTMNTKAVPLYSIRSTKEVPLYSKKSTK